MPKKKKRFTIAQYRKQRRQYMQKYRNENKERAIAHSRLSEALFWGKIIKSPCRDCGNLRVHGHHPNYSKPLEVIWLCSLHHKAEHKLQTKKTT